MCEARRRASIRADSDAADHNCAPLGASLLFHREGRSPRYGNRARSENINSANTILRTFSVPHFPSQHLRSPGHRMQFDNFNELTVIDKSRTGPYPYPAKLHVDTSNTVAP